MLLALNLATQAVQRARTPEEVYHVIGAELTKLGIQGSILTLTADRTHLAYRHTTHEPALLEKAKKLTNLSPAGYRFPLQPGGIFERCVVQKETMLARGVVGHWLRLYPAPCARWQRAWSRSWV